MDLISEDVEEEQSRMEKYTDQYSQNEEENENLEDFIYGDIDEDKASKIKGKVHNKDYLTKFVKKKNIVKDKHSTSGQDELSSEKNSQVSSTNNKKMLTPKTANSIKTGKIIKSNFKQMIENYKEEDEINQDRQSLLNIAPMDQENLPDGITDKVLSEKDTGQEVETKTLASD